MNKKELVAEMATKCSLTQRQCAVALDAFIDAVTDSLANNESVSVQGFGNFKVTQTDPRVGRNPKTGKPVEIPAGLRCGFSFSKVVKDFVNKR